MIDMIAVVFVKCIESYLVVNGCVPCSAQFAWRCVHLAGGSWLYSI